MGVGVKVTAGLAPRARWDLRAAASLAWEVGEAERVRHALGQAEQVVSGGPELLRIAVAVGVLREILDLLRLVVAVVAVPVVDRLRERVVPCRGASVGVIPDQLRERVA